MPRELRPESGYELPMGSLLPFSATDYRHVFLHFSLICRHWRSTAPRPFIERWDHPQRIDAPGDAASSGTSDDLPTLADPNLRRANALRQPPIRPTRLLRSDDIVLEVFPPVNIPGIIQRLGCWKAGDAYWPERKRPAPVAADAACRGSPLRRATELQKARTNRKPPSGGFLSKHTDGASPDPQTDHQRGCLASPDVLFWMPA